MTQQYSTDLRDARAACFETILGASPVLEIRTGAQPANCAAADSGTLLASLTLPSDWIGAPSSGVITMVGTWEDLSANADGVAAHFRLKTSGGTCKWQGSVTATGGGGDMTVNNVNFATGQPFSVTTFQVTEAGA